MKRRPTFLWQGLLIVFPVLVLTAAGVFSLWRDREAVTLDARRATAQYGERIAALLAEDLTAASNDLSASMSVWELAEDGRPWPNGAVVDREGTLLRIGAHGAPGDFLRTPAAAPFPLDLLAPGQAELWVEAPAAERRGTETGAEAYGRFLATEPPEPFLSNARYSHSVLLAAAGEIAAALDGLRAVEETDERTETGLPLAVLARFQRVRLLAERRRQGEAGDGALSAAIDGLCVKALARPSFATPSLLLAAEGFVEDLDEELADPIRVSRAIWLVDENTRRFHRAARPLLFAKRTPGEPFWFEWEGRPVLVGMAPAGENDAAAGPGAERFEMFCYDEEVLRRRVSRLLSQAPLQPPAFVMPAVSLHGRRVSEAEPRGEALATVEAAWPAGADAAGGIEILLHLSEPELLYARQRQRAFWFGALILMAAGTALVGFAAARKAFFRERRLSEMKSDFVASVSHELRAPLASVRLMAEGLERGTVRQPEKQQSYYRFIVQECGRLSTLIENVLDFARIERDRKEYVFEPTDVTALVRETVELMRPAAGERKVRLEIRIDPGSEPENLQPEIDGKAIRQALVNLIDNAIKHSPPGAAVVVGLSAGNRDTGGAGPLWLSVEDRGEGIPAGERERIFERFYRIGSELRRETQGAGIGLSIVRHIVEAHGGKIRVEGEPGKGSRFTIEIDGTHTHS